MNRVATVVPRTPTSATSSILMSSPSTNSEAIFQVKQEDIEYQLLSPISASSPMHHGLGGNRGGHGMHHTKIIKVRYHSRFFVGHKTICSSSHGIRTPKLRTPNESINQRNWKFGPMWQTIYALAVLKNFGVGVDFQPCSEGDFLTWGVRSPWLW